MQCVDKRANRFDLASVRFAERPRFGRRLHLTSTVQSRDVRRSKATAAPSAPSHSEKFAIQTSAPPCRPINRIGFGPIVGLFVTRVAPWLAPLCYAIVCRVVPSQQTYCRTPLFESCLKISACGTEITAKSSNLRETAASSLRDAAKLDRADLYVSFMQHRRQAQWSLLRGCDRVGKRRLAVSQM